MGKKKGDLLFSLFLFLFIGSSWSQTVYPSTIKIPVTFYDFHADGSCPDFKGQQQTETHLAMASSSISSDGHLMRGDLTFFSYFLSKWFEPWRQGNDFSRPVYIFPMGALDHIDTVAFDTSYKNGVINDTLDFAYIAGTDGIFRYENDNFFPIDGKGLGNEGNIHNYSFSMKFEWDFTYKKGLRLPFGGSDDSWVYLNGKLVVDLGGMHSAESTVVNLDTIQGLVDGQKYKLCFFHAQRSPDISSIIMSSGVIVAYPACIKILSTPFNDDTLSYGDSLKLTYAIIKTCESPSPKSDTLPVAWKLVPSVSNFNSRLRDSSGIENVFYAGNGYGQFLIITTTIDSALAKNYPDTMRVYVKLPPVKYALWIEPDTNIDPNGTTPQILSRLRSPDPVSQVGFSKNGDIAAIAAVKRDQYGNFVGFPSNALWQVIGDSGVVRISTPAKPYLCMIEGLNYGKTLIRLSDDSGSFPDTVPVENYYDSCITKIKLVNAVTGRKIDSVYINTDQDITIKVMGVLSTDPTQNNWIDVTGSWSLNPGDIAVLNPLPPSPAGQWVFSPIKPCASLLTVTVRSGPAPLSITIPVTVFTCAGPIPLSDCANVKRPMEISRAEKEKVIREYYNLRGQKLQGFANSRLGGIVLERVIGHGGTMSVNKRFLGTDSRMRNQE